MHHHHHHPPPVGPYTRYVKDLAEGGYPNLAHLYRFLESEKPRSVEVKLVDLNKDGRNERPACKIRTRDIQDRTTDPLDKNILARIFIVSDLNTDVIEALGTSLNLEPAFFAEHISDRFLEKDIAVGQCPHLPSVSKITSFYTIDYFTAITLDKPTVHRLRCDFNVRRRVDTFHVDMMPGKTSQISHVAFVRRKYSFHVQMHHCWKVVVLVDPAIGEFRPEGRHQTRRDCPLKGLKSYTRNAWPSLVGHATFLRVDHGPERGRKEEFEFANFQGGHLDISPPPRYKSVEIRHQTRRKDKSSPCDDLVYYWERFGRLEKGELVPFCSTPSKASCRGRCAQRDAKTQRLQSTPAGTQGATHEDHCRKRRFLFDISRHGLFIAASECMLVLEALHGSADERIWNLKALDLSEVVWLQRTTTALERCLDDTLRLKHQLIGQCRHLDHVKEFLKSVAKIPSEYREMNDKSPLDVYPVDCGGGPECEQCGATNSAEKDDYGLWDNFEFITKSMGHYRDTCDSTIDLVASLMAVRDSHQSGTLARLGLIFAPISLAYGVMSLPGNFAPGQQMFWVFWVAAPLLLVITFVFAFIPWDKTRFLSKLGLAHNDLGDDSDDESNLRKLRHCVNRIFRREESSSDDDRSLP